MLRTCILTSFVLMLLAGCNYWPGYSASKVDMTGTWRFREGPLTTTYVFRADGTFTENVSVPSPIPQPADQTGKWYVEGDSKLHLTAASAADLDAGTSFPITINGSSISFRGEAPGSVFTRQ